MKKRLIDFTLEEMQALNKDRDYICNEPACDNDTCCNCKYFGLCCVSFFDVDFSEEYDVPKLKPELLEVEKVILENLDKEYRWIVRNKSGDLYLHKGEPVKSGYIWYSPISVSCFDIYNHLFDFIKWEDEEPYCIEKLLK